VAIIALRDVARPESLPSNGGKLIFNSPAFVGEVAFVALRVISRQCSTSAALGVNGQQLTDKTH